MRFLILRQSRCGRSSSQELIFRCFFVHSVCAPLRLREFRVRDAIFTTDDSSKPDFHVRSKSVRIYPDSRVVFSNSTVYIGQTPIFWFPVYLCQYQQHRLRVPAGLLFALGAYLLTAYSFPIGTGDSVIGKVHRRSSLRARSGRWIRYESSNMGKDDRSYGDFISYYAFDTQPDQALAGSRSGKGDEGRYRVTFKHRLFLTDDIYATADINLLSDVDFLEDLLSG